MIRHIVLFTLADDTPPAAEQEVADSLRALPEQVEVIEALALAKPFNPGAHDYALTVDVADEEALEAYRHHPAHVPVVERLRELVSEIAVADIVIEPATPSP